MKYHIGWQRFLEHLNFQATRKDLSLEQSEALSYMQAYAGYNRKVMKRVPKSLLDAYIETFMQIPTTEKRTTK